jgi:hypothetical protein
MQSHASRMLLLTHGSVCCWVRRFGHRLRFLAGLQKLLSNPRPAQPDHGHGGHGHSQQSASASASAPQPQPAGAVSKWDDDEDEDDGWTSGETED